MPNLLDSPAWCEARLRDDVPNYFEAADWAVVEVASWLGLAHSENSSHSIATLLTMVTNDFVDLLFDLGSGRGRAAIRVARSIVESAINARWLIADAGEDQRYVDHAAVTAMLLGSLSDDLELLQGNERRSEEHARRKLRRDAEGDLNAAVTRFGPAFRRDWATRNLYDRAAQVGLSDRYDFYRLASAVLHGSFGGSLGIRRAYGESYVHRTGPALSLCPHAFFWGLATFRTFVADISTTLSVAGDGVQAATGALRDTWTDYRRTVLKLDKAVWPDEPPPPPIAVLALYADVRPQWFLHDVRMGLIVRAEKPSSLTPEQEEVVVDFQAKAPQLLQEYGVEPVTIAMLGASTAPKAGASWQPDRVVLKAPTRLEAAIQELGFRPAGVVSD